MDHRHRRARTIPCAAAALVALAACAGPVTPPDLVTRLADEPTSADSLPGTLVPVEMDPGSARRLGELDGVVFYAGSGTRDGEDLVCLVVALPGDTPTGDSGASTCGPVTDLDDADLPLAVQMSGVRVTATLVPDGLPTDGGLTRVTPNLAAAVDRTP
ncbi:hypothetical protein [Cellulosimicrobium composti]|uniref:Secreted protein n=1 Tax=Cellulosimicrobium composti TaxID=2672572 RepID=A0ABX0B729_9MICO|nr:hypothetical protein [Cellulosimicrobium composti]NDO88312.1 hypothetical protein [Cellulosimicrobium composti]